MSLIDNAISHFTETSDHELHKIDVEEWSGAIWFKSDSGQNCIQRQKYLKYLIKTHEDISDLDSCAELMIYRARNEDGTKMFTSADKDTLMMRVSPDVLRRIVNEMSVIDNEIREAVKKK